MNQYVILQYHNMDKNIENIIYKDINSLISAEYNPRQLNKEQYNNIKDSLKRI